MKTLLALGAFAAAAVSSAPAMAANLIVNGDFETGVDRSVPGWIVEAVEPNSVLRVTGQDYQICCGATGDAAALANHFVAFGAGDSSNANSGLGQIFAAANGVYTLSFAYGAFGGSQTLSFALADLADLANPFFSGSVTASNVTDFNNIFSTYTSNVALNGSGVYALVFTNDGSPTASVDAVLDNVSFAAVPEPATWAMMLVGFGAVGATMRRRRTAGTLQTA